MLYDGLLQYTGIFIFMYMVLVLFLCFFAEYKRVKHVKVKVLQNKFKI